MPEGTSNLAAQRPGRLRIGVVGAGRVGAVIGSALRAVGHDIVGASGDSDASRERIDTLLPGVPRLEPQAVVERSEVVLLAVPDDALAPVIEGLAALGAWQAGQIVIHVSGSVGISVLDPAVRCGVVPIALHPAMTFTGTTLDISRLEGICCAVTAPAPFLPIGQALAVELGAEPVVVPEEQRALYHAALAHGANHLVVLVAQAAELLVKAGIDRPGAVLEPLMSAALDGALRGANADSDPINTLTGPVARGDVGTIARHVGVVAQAASTSVTTDALASYQELSRGATVRSLAAGRLSERQAQGILDALQGSPGPT